MARLLPAALLSMAMAAGADEQDDNGTPPVTASVANQGTIPLQSLKRGKMRGTSSDMFGAKSWHIAAPAPPPPPPPPVTAPPLPFSFMGKMQEPDGKLTIYLEGRDRVYLVKGGEIIDNIYHIDGIVNGKLSITYIPLGNTEYLGMGETP